MRVGNDGGKDSRCAQLSEKKSKRVQVAIFLFLIRCFFFYISKILNKQRLGYCAAAAAAEMYSFCLCSVHMVKDAQNASAIFMHIARCAPCFQQSTV